MLGGVKVVAISIHSMSRLNVTSRLFQIMLVISISEGFILQIIKYFNISIMIDAILHEIGARICAKLSHILKNS